MHSASAIWREIRDQMGQVTVQKRGLAKAKGDK